MLEAICKGERLTMTNNEIKCQLCDSKDTNVHCGVIQLCDKCASKQMIIEDSCRCIFCKSYNTISTVQRKSERHSCTDCKSKWTTDQQGILSKSRCFAENSYSWWVRETKPDPNQPSEKQIHQMISSDLIPTDCSMQAFEVMREERLKIEISGKFRKCKGMCEAHGHINCVC